MKEIALVVWTAVLAFMRGGFGYFFFLLYSKRSKVLHPDPKNELEN